MKNIEVRQIFYNEETRANVKEPFIPLDNTRGEKSWFEFWPILNFLNNNTLREDTLYGFLSPKFTAKTGISAAQAIDILQNRETADALLFSYRWDLLSYFLNPWEQGEIWHPGITRETQKFLNYVNINLDLKYLITSCRDSVFSNFIIANKKYWSLWKEIALIFYQYTNNPQNSLYNMTTTYMNKKYPMKVFIQERISAIILSQMHFHTDVIDCKNTKTSFFILNTKENRKQLRFCNHIKENIINNRFPNTSLKAFLDARKKIVFYGGPEMQWGHRQKSDICP